MAALLLASLFGLNIYRAAAQSITVDEAFTFTRFVAPPLADMAHGYDANNHVLYTLLAKVTVGLFGPHELALRLPSLLGGLLFFVGLFLVSRRLFGDGWWLLLSVALNGLNPYVLDYLSMARGYGLALGLWICALYLLLDAGESWRRVWAAGALMGLAILANLVFLVPCAALGACWVLQVRPLRKALRQATALLFTVALVAGPLLAFALQSAKRDNFYYGAPTARLAAAMMVQGTLFHGATFLNTVPSIGRFLNQSPPWIMAGCLAIMALALLADSLGRWRAGLGWKLAAGSLAGSALIVYAMRRGLGVPYPTGRTGLYFAPLLALSVVGLLARVRWRPAAWLCALPLMALLVQFAAQLTATHYFEARWDAATKRIVERLGRERNGRPVRLGAAGYLIHGYNYYREAYGYKWLEPSGFTGTSCLFDYYVANPEERAAVFTKYRVKAVYHNALSEQTLGVFDPAAFPEIEQLAALGYRDPIPCAVDFNKLSPEAPIGRPGAELQILRDVLEAQGPWQTVWVADRPALLLRAKETERRVLTMQIVTHGMVLGKVGPQSLTVRLNGHELGRQTYPTEGQHTYRQKIPAEWLQPGGMVLVEILPDRWWVAPDDGQKLSVLLGRVALEGE